MCEVMKRQLQNGRGDCKTVAANDKFTRRDY